MVIIKDIIAYKTMKKLRGRLSIKILATILLMISGLTMLVGMAGIILSIDTMESSSSIQDAAYERVTEYYGRCILKDLLDEGDKYDENSLSGMPFSYAIVKCENTYNTDYCDLEYISAELIYGDKSVTTSEDTFVEATTNDYIKLNKKADFLQVMFAEDYTISYTYNRDYEEGDETFFKLLNGGTVTTDYSESEDEIISYRVFLKLDKSKIGTSDTFSNGMTNLYKEADQWINIAEWVVKYGVVIFLISLVMALATAVYLLYAAGFRKNDDELHLSFIDKIPYGILFGITAFVVCIGGYLDICLFVWQSYGYINLYNAVILAIVIYIVWVFVAELFFMSTKVRIAKKCFWHYTVFYYVCKPFRKLIDYVNINVRFFWQALTVLGIVTFLQLFVIVCTNYNTELEVFLFVVYKLIEVPFILWVVMQLKALYQGGCRVANGDYSKPVNTERMLYDFCRHGEHINSIGDGIALAVEERMKSERFKTELITNVSHDIKTPLTSIINYVDLLEKEQIDNETAKEYIEVLDRQSERLKKLIEDLIEASKASSGALSVTMEEIDAIVMIEQVVGEFSEKLADHGLNVIVNAPEPPLAIMADGRHFWRVLDNLMNNICKYAQENTRVYVDIKNENGKVEMVFRNISKDQLNISADELLERFVRGDKSRNREGHGLGLNIAQSLTNLMNGQLSIAIDGDLFKVTLTFCIK